MKKITVLLASQKQNLSLAQTIATELENHNANVSIIDLVDVDLPLYSSKVQVEQGMPPQLDALFKSCQSADGFVIVAPEYNGGTPPVLTNAIAWLSVKGEQWRDAVNAKVVGLASFSGGGGASLISGLRIQLAYIGMTVLGRSLQVTYKKPLNDDSLKDFAAQLIQRV